MTEAMDRPRVRFPGISSRAYEHPADRSALVAMRALSGFDALLRKLSGLFRERSLRLLFLSTGVRASHGQFRHLHDLVRDASYTLDLREVPEIYVVQDANPTAMTLGSERPFIVLSTGVVDLLDTDELRFVIGHEVGHVLSGHAVYRTMLFHLTRLAARAVWIPLGYLGLRAIVAALEEWYRKSELSGDRAGLLVGQHREAALRALMKIAGGGHLQEMNTAAFLEQAEEYDRAADVREGLIKLLNLQGATHPFAAPRAAELDRWAHSDEYRRLLEGQYARREDDREASLSEEIKNAARSYQESVDTSSDPLANLVRDFAGTASDAGEKIFGRFGRRPGS